jgi:hypothetical protein
MARPRKIKIEERSRSDRKTAGKDRRLMTAVSFSGEELAALGEYIAAGIVLLRVTTPHRALGKFKAAMSRVKLVAPRGL